MPATIPNGGTYTVEISTGYTLGGFTLNNAVSGLLNGTAGVLDGRSEYADITSEVDSFSIRRGRRTVTDQMPVSGTCSIKINDESEAFNPYNTSSVYYNPVLNEPGLAPLRKVRISRGANYIFVGRITAFDQTYKLGGIDEITATASDDIYLLSQTALDAFTPASQTASARISTVLARPEVSFTGTTSITASPITTLGAYPVAAGTSTTAYLGDINDAEQGRLFCNRSNTLVFQPRITAAVSAPVASFSDVGGAGIPYNDLQIEFDQNIVINRAAVTITGGTQQTATNAASISTYYTQSKEYGNSLLSTDAQALTLANYLLVPNPNPRFTAVSSWFGALSAGQRDTVALLDIGDLIQITKTDSFGTTTEASYIEGLETTVTFDYGQTSRFYTTQTTVYEPFLLNSATQGTLDSDNALT
jgi:hypothetical protein